MKIWYNYSVEMWVKFMKKVLNVFGVFGSIILTIVLTVVMFLYVLLINVKVLIGEKGFANTFKRVNVETILKTADEGEVWNGIKEISKELNLSDEQLIEILDSKNIKEQLGDFFGEVLSSSLNDKDVYLTKERLTNFLTDIIDEYSKVSGVPTNDIERELILSTISDEMILDINESLNTLNIKSAVDTEFLPVINVVDKLIYANYSLIILGIIIAIISLIALFGFSYYKWISYANTALVINGILFLMVGLFLYLVPLQNLEVIVPFKMLVVQNLIITVAILFGSAITFAILKNFLNKTDKDCEK